MDPRQLDYIRNDVIITKLFDLLKANNELYTEGETPAEKPAKKPAAAKSNAAKKPASKKKTEKE